MKIVVLIAALATATLSLRCMNASYVSAPPGTQVMLLADCDRAAHRYSMKNWYLFEGLIALSDNNAANLIGRYGLKNVRVKTFQTFGDWIISLLTAGVITTTTTQVVGNTVEK